MAEPDSSLPPASLPDSGAVRRRSREHCAGNPDASTGSTDLDRRLADCIRLLEVAEHDSERRAEEAADLRAKADERDRLATRLAEAQAERDALLQSTSWRLTAPLRALTERRRSRSPGAPRAPATRPADGGGRLSRVAEQDDPDAAAMLRAFREPLPQGPARVTLVLDSLGAAVSGASAAAVAIAAALAQRQAAPLRIVGRRVPQATESLDQLLAAQGLSFHANPSFDWLTLDGRGPTLGVTEGERFVTASLDDARLAVSLGQPARVVYVLYWRELPRLLGPEPARPTPAGCPSARAALVCEDTELREALDAAGRLDGRDPNLPVLALPAPPAAPDWLGVAARLLAGAESA